MPAPASAPPPSWRARLRDWVADPLDPPQREAFRAEQAQANVRRLRVLLPLMVVLHTVHVFLFRTTDTLAATLPAHLLVWRHDLVLAHAVSLAFAVTALGVVLAFGRTRAATLLGPGVALGYLVHGAVIAGIDQLSMASVTVFIGYALGVAVVVSFTPLAALAVYGGALVAFVASIEAMQPSASARLMVLPNGFSIVAVSVALTVLLHGARRRDYAQRLTIDRQREQLADMNAGLERRVTEQVSEIVERVRQVEELNAQLQAQVRARSTELSMTLAKLAHDRGLDGKLRSGLVLGNRYVIGDLLGEGGMGAVYSGTDRVTNGPVAIKVIQAASAQQLDALHRFLREAGTVAQVAHPAVVRMLHVDVSDDGMLYQVQELVVGETLYDRLQDDRMWTASRAARLVAVLCDALAAAHAKGVVHRDVKPGNIMLTGAPPGLKLLDFGISKLLRDRDASSHGNGNVIGTPAYIAPEVLIGTAKATDRADVYAVGVVLFLMLSTRYPFDDTTTRSVILNRVAYAAPDVRTFAPDVPAPVAELVARCLAKEPAERPAAKEVAVALSAFADEEKTPSLESLPRIIASDGARPRAPLDGPTLTAGKRPPPG
jgi:hypothetical protein